LVNDLLDLAKAEAGRIEPNLTDVDLKAVFGQLRGTLRPLATRPEVDFVVEEPGVPSLRTDEVLLSQVLRNLLTNALKFTESGSVRLTAARAGFEEFYQVPGSTALSGKGTGLGLPYARRLVDVLGGALLVSSEVGRGSTFTVRLPLGSP
jgi:signal transduction histidine kinase